MFKKIIALSVSLIALVATPAWAQTAAPTLDSGDTAWILTSTALVLFMTMPGLALFYGGLVRAKNVLSVMAQCAGIAFMASILWVAVGYSLAFKGDGGWIGNLDAAHHIQEYVFIMRGNATMPMQHCEQQRQPVLIQTNGQAPR